MLSSKYIKILFIFLGIFVVSGIFLGFALAQSEPVPTPPPAPAPGDIIIPPAPAVPAATQSAIVWIPAVGAVVGGIGSFISGLAALIIVLKKSRT